MKTKEWLRKMRDKLGLSRKEFAKEVGVSPDIIKSVEEGRRTGNDETWGRIIYYLKTQKINEVVKFSFDCEDIINEIKEDIEEFGEEEICYLFYKIEDDMLLFTNYDFIVEEKPILKEELEPGEHIIETKLKYILEVFENQNDIL